jgi:hypothetical protein
LRTSDPSIDRIGKEGNAHGARAETHAHRHVAPFVEFGFSGLHMMAHHLRYAPQDSLAEPARHDVIAGTRSEQQITVARNDAARAGQPLASGPNERPDHAHGRARHGAAADPDRISVTYERGGFLERDDLLAQASIAA